MAGPVTTSRCPSDRACKGLDGMAGRKDLACSKVRKAWDCNHLSKQGTMEPC